MPFIKIIVNNFEIILEHFCNMKINYKIITYLTSCFYFYIFSNYVFSPNSSVIKYLISLLITTGVLPVQ